MDLVIIRFCFLETNDVMNIFISVLVISNAIETVYHSNDRKVTKLLL